MECTYIAVPPIEFWSLWAPTVAPASKCILFWTILFRVPLPPNPNPSPRIWCVHVPLSPNPMLPLDPYAARWPAVLSTTPPSFRPRPVFPFQPFQVFTTPAFCTCLFQPHPRSLQLPAHCISEAQHPCNISKHWLGTAGACNANAHARHVDRRSKSMCSKMLVAHQPVYLLVGEHS